MGWIIPKTALVLATAWLFCLIIDDGSAIKCWSCDSSLEPDCGDPFNNKTITAVDCSQLPKKCKKVKQEGKVIRSCALETERDAPINCTKAKNDKGVMVETCFCDDKEACNSMAGNSAGISTVTTVGMVTSLFFSVMVYAMQ